MQRTFQIVAVVLLALLLGACGESNQVGGEELLEFDPDASGGPRLGERSEEPTPIPTPTPTPEAVVTTQAPPPPPPQETQEPPPPPPQETQAPPQETGPQVALDIAITGDQSGTSQFDPSAARIYSDTCARWINQDSVQRSVEADEGAFSSGPIEPDGEWVWCPGDTGRFNYHDGTRPYAVAFIEVVPR